MKMAGAVALAVAALVKKYGIKLNSGMFFTGYG